MDEPIEPIKDPNDTEVLLLAQIEGPSGNLSPNDTFNITQNQRTIYEVTPSMKTSLAEESALLSGSREGEKSQNQQLDKTEDSLLFNNAMGSMIQDSANR